MNHSPSPAILYSMRQTNMAWKTIVGELIDNSFDAAAKQITIELAPRTMTVSDDGRGCEDLNKMVILGLHHHQSSTSLGRYGVGLNDAAAALWGDLVITSATANSCSRCRIDWDKLASGDEWNSPDPVPATRPQGRGTTLSFQRISTDRKIPTGVYLERLIRDIGFTFAPALRDGRQILVKKGRREIACKAYSMPFLSNIIEDELDVNGRRIKIRVGIIKDGEKNLHPGLSFLYGHRVIETCTLGFREYSHSKIAGEVELLDSSWPLKKNKDGITDGRARDELGDAIYKRCWSLFKTAKEQADHIQLDALNKDVAALVSMALGRGREKHGKRGGAKTAKTGKSSGTQRRRARRTQPGDRPLRVSGEIRIEYVDGDGERLGTAEYADGKAIVTLDTSNAYVEHIRNAENKPAIALAVITLLADEHFAKGERDKLPGMRDYSSISETLGDLLPRLVEGNGMESPKADVAE